MRGHPLPHLGVMTKSEPSGKASNPLREGLRRPIVRWLVGMFAVEVAAVGLVAGAVFGVFGAWPQQQADRLREATREWQEQALRSGSAGV